METYASLARRFGLDIVRSFREDFSPLLEVVWVDESIHDRGLDLLLERRRRGLSLVDATSFVVARDRRIHRAFAFDRHFEEQGFELVR